MALLEEIVRRRLEQSRDNIAYSLEMARDGNPFAGETDQRRREERLQTKAQLTPREAGVVNEQVEERARQHCGGRAWRRHVGTEGRGAEETAPSPRPPTAAAAEEDEERPDLRERVWGDTVDFVSVSFLERGAKVARAVGRVATRVGANPIGTGVLIGKGLFLTNNHVIESVADATALMVEFDYEQDLDGRHREVSRFAIDPSVFLFDPVQGLDFTIVALGERMDGPNALDAFGFCGLSDARDKHMIGEFANIVQHPSGRMKEVVLRENRLVSRYEDALHYVADTEPGSSGSPVFNSEWRLIALHHWGGPWIAGGGPAGDMKINEGIRCSSIVRKLRARLRYLPDHVRDRVGFALDIGEKAVPERKPEAGGSPAEANGLGPRIDPTGRVTWTIPLELSLNLPFLAGAGGEAGAPPKQVDARAAGNVDDRKLLRAFTADGEAGDYDDRTGYQSDFLGDVEVPMPRLSPALEKLAARRLDARAGDNPIELTYTHFSIVMNRKRRLAFFTACNIDGTTAKSIQRGTRAISDLEPTAPGLRETVASLDGAEADSWSHDPRLSREDYCGPEIYERQMVPGHPDPRSNDRMIAMFQRGHLVRRLDPAWGENNTALTAELDTFHWTNAAPQLGAFNQGLGDPDKPGTGKGKLWRSVENFVLRSAVAERMRVTSFTGPVFRDDDPPYRGIRIPRQFFKLTVWVEDGRVRALALLADQGLVLDALPEAADGELLPERISDDDARIEDFLSTVEEIEELTGLSFGDAVAAGDIRRGRQRAKAAGELDVGLGPSTPASRSGGRKRTARADAGGSVTGDDLTRISGLGPVFARKLGALGVETLAAIAAWTPADVAAFAGRIGAGDRIRSEDWVGQAKRLIAEGG